MMRRMKILVPVGYETEFVGICTVPNTVCKCLYTAYSMCLNAPTVNIAKNGRLRRFIGMYRVKGGARKAKNVGKQ